MFRSTEVFWPQKSSSANSFCKLCDYQILTEKLHSFTQEWPKTISALIDEINADAQNGMNSKSDMLGRRNRGGGGKYIKSGNLVRHA